ncbi:MAG: dienelactone hydrolase family protein [Bacteroidota bacterium]|nr:dienelactone hydrolase family protein [Bacteroidota bacterium]
MQKQKLSFKHQNGTVDGIYLDAGTGSALVIIINGHNGFYNYGMFPYIQETLFRNGISSYSFNFSHGGVIGDSDYFDDLEKYEKNCMRLETEDLLSVLHHLKSGEFKQHPKVFLLAHSLGGVPAIFGSKKAQEEHIKIDGIILVSTIKSLDFWGKEITDAWKRNLVYFKKNNRTKQELPQGFEFLQEVLSCNTHWNIETAIKLLKQPILIVYGEKDEAVSKDHAESLYAWSKEHNPDTLLKIIPNATHTFNTKHPFEGASDALIELLDLVVNWIQKH